MKMNVVAAVVGGLIVGAGAIDKIKLLPVPFDVENGWKDTVSVFLLYGEIVTNGVFGIHVSTAFDVSTLVEHRLSERGFPRSRTSQ
jgi:hypothetical protein